MSGTQNTAAQVEEDLGCIITADLYRNGTDRQGHSSVTIRVTEQEKNLFDLLKECVVFSGLNIDLRVAGGWVRDKLLNLSSKDIDIALEGITGVEFCDYLNAFTEKNFGFHKTVGVVKRRPEQSKHLETATISIMGLNIDFVNLRSEDYASDSRIPVMKIGTPLEDAMRRDFTINSLFYNISKNRIEDYTGKGIEDLKARVIRTCSPAFGTFMDDPLRVVRAARFSARLGYKLDDEIINSGSHPDVLQQFAHKVAKGRIAQEIDDMLAKGDPTNAFEHMKAFKIIPILVREQPGDAPSDDQIESGCQTMAAVRECLDCLEWGNVDKKVLYMAAFFSSLLGEPKVDKCTYIEHIIKHRLKLPNKLASGANVVAEGSLEFIRMNDLPDDEADLRELLGTTIRQIGPLWKEALVLSMAMERFDIEPDKLTQKYKHILSLIYELSMEDSYTIKAPITGKELMELVPGLSPGPMFKEALDFQVKQINDVALSKQLEIWETLIRKETNEHGLHVINVDNANVHPFHNEKINRKLKRCFMTLIAQHMVEKGCGFYLHTIKSFCKENQCSVWYALCIGKNAKSNKLMAIHDQQYQAVSAKIKEHKTNIKELKNKRDSLVIENVEVGVFSKTLEETAEDVLQHLKLHLSPNQVETVYFLFLGEKESTKQFSAWSEEHIAIVLSSLVIQKRIDLVLSETVPKRNISSKQIGIKLVY
ncbi:tRNA nucleotidyltransferase [Babesia ovis]|uniref:tRNA nucleotidyltransferase n=1 Tax=Babesia ovis TaxID=5869 RepID=A0A9W5WWG4_BABOV|nr:tRNA nucleotidyltransferase [Babesia ovis]